MRQPCALRVHAAPPRADLSDLAMFSAFSRGGECPTSGAARPASGRAGPICAPRREPGVAVGLLAAVLAARRGRARPTRAAGRDFRAPPTPRRAIRPTGAFIKEWEATPPKGYPTLSPANVAAMKAAIKRYTEIVGRPAAGSRCPTSSCSRACRIRPSPCCASACSCPATCGRQGGSQQLRLLRRQGGEALPGLQRPGADRHRRQAHDRGAQHAGRVAPQAAEDEPRAPERSARKSQASATSSSTSRRRRSRRSRATASCRATPASSASPTGRRRS